MPIVEPCGCACHNRGAVQCMWCCDDPPAPAYGPPAPPDKAITDELLIDTPGTKDGRVSADHDQPFKYNKPSVQWPYPFRHLELAKLMIMRARFGERSDADRSENEPPI